MSLNWGHKLVIVFILFGTLIGYLVYRSVTTNFDLVSKEYYKDELAYQQVIDGTKRAGELSSAVAVVQDNDSLVIRFPEEMKSGSIKGQAWFYYAPDMRRDRKLPLETTGNTEVKFSRSIFIPGNYTVKISWENNGEQYYSEQKATIE